MNLQQLRVFLKVAELEHITHASEDLGFSQPAVTKMVQSLEQEIGLELIRRRKKGVALTPAGRLFLTYAHRMLGLEQEMEEALAALRNLEGGTVSLAVNTITGMYLMPALVARFQSHAPCVTVHLALLSMQDIVEQLVDGKIDLGLIEGMPPSVPTGLHVELLFTEELALVVAPHHQWSKLSVMKSEMRQEEALFPLEGRNLRERAVQVLPGYRGQTYGLPPLEETAVIKQMVLRGAGAALVSTRAIQQELLNGDLVRIPVSGLDVHPQLYLIRRAEKQFSRVAHAFCTVLRLVIREEWVLVPCQILPMGMEKVK
jgi:DNA-binding transcriptional LysR family regulator